MSLTNRLPVLFCGLLGACASASPTLIDSLIDTAPEPAGANCPTGGIAVRTGPDRNGNHVLDPDEVTRTSYVCNGATPHGQVSGVAAEPAGANCAAGGLRITSGADDNGNGTLEGSEVESTKYVCNGEPGMSGMSASPSTLVDVASEPVGQHCAAGGLKLTSGPDTDRDGTLDGNEVTDTSYICNGDPVAANGSSPIVTVSMDDRTNVPTDGSSTTVRQASITVPRQGRVLIVWSADVFCANPALGQGYDCGAGVNDGYLTLTAVSTDAANTGLSSYFYLQPNVTESVSRTAVYTIPQAGTYTFYLRASQGNNSTTRFGVFRAQVTIAFTPT